MILPEAPRSVSDPPQIPFGGGGISWSLGGSLDFWSFPISDCDTRKVKPYYGPLLINVGNRDFLFRIFLVRYFSHNFEVCLRVGEQISEQFGSLGGFRGAST